MWFLVSLIIGYFINSVYHGGDFNEASYRGSSADVRRVPLMI